MSGSYNQRRLADLAYYIKYERSPAFILCNDIFDISPTVLTEIKIFSFKAGIINQKNHVIMWYVVHLLWRGI